MKNPFEQKILGEEIEIERERLPRVVEQAFRDIDKTHESTETTGLLRGERFATINLGDGSTKYKMYAKAVKKSSEGDFNGEEKVFEVTVKDGEIVE